MSLRHRAQRSLASACLACVPLLIFSFNIRAQTAEPTSEPQPIHWAFASLVGTGWYEVGDGRKAFVIGATPRQVVRRPALTDSGERRVGVNVRYDAALGIYSFDDLFQIADIDNFSTLSLTPGIELVIPINQRWRLRTFANFGWGSSLDQESSAWIYYTGIKSRYLFDVSWGEIALQNGFYYGGFSPDPGPSDQLAALYTGIELRHEAGSASWNEEPLDFLWHLGYTLMDDQADFGLRDGTIESISDNAEIGVAVALRNRPFRVWGFEFERVGVSYAKGIDSDFGSITVNFSSWFDQ